MPIQVFCPHCQAKLNAPDSLAGKMIKCPKCAKIGAVPLRDEPPTTQWHVQLPDGSEFGPVTRAELDEWFREERLTEECQLLKEGSDQWQWATDIYPSLAPQVAAALSSPQAKKLPQATVPQKPAANLQPQEPDLEPIYDDPFSSSQPAIPFGAQNNSPLVSEYGLQVAAPLQAAPLQPAPLQPTTYSPANYDPYTAPAQPMPAADDNINELSPLGRVGIFIAVVPLVICCREMAPGWGMFGMSPLVGIPLVMVAGLIGGAMIGGRYVVPGAIAGVIANFGAAVATVAHLAAVDETHTAVMALFGALGSLPGMGIYFIGRFIQKMIFPRRA